jgi:alkanesulfonate monooxygenase SsuD/methylene tetrahydromethanopterin reductase-like flavin-dependent oxidoreductase (luciferase family)
VLLRKDVGDGAMTARMNGVRRFGVTLSWPSASIQTMKAVACEADDLGYGHFWVQEAWGLEALSTIGYLLGVTKRIRIGSGILNVYSRSAALVGMSCATLDQIAPGRFMLGLGSSGKALVEDWHGIKFEKPLNRTVEYIQVIKKVAKGEPVNYDGETIHLKRFRLFSKPLKDAPDIYVGAISEKNLELAAEIADGAILVMYPMSGLDKVLKLLNKKKAFAYYRARITSSKDEESKARLQLARSIAFYVASMGKYYARNLAKLGYSKDVSRIAEADARLGSKGAAEVVSPELLEELTLVGSAKYVLEKISERIPEEVYPVFDFGIASPEEAVYAVNSLRSIASESTR